MVESEKSKMCKCEIKWIDSHGNETPDDNEAIGIAVCTSVTDTSLEKTSFPICSNHYQKMLTMSNWKLEPLPVVIEAVKNAFRQSDDILKSLRYHHGDNFWSFNLHGMFVGIEQDGYIHT